MTEFCVRSGNFFTLSKFKKECESVGWKYKALGNVSFSAGAMLVNDCLYYSDTWEGQKMKQPMFAFSNCNETEAIVIYNLDTETGYRMAVTEMRNQYERNKK